ncbi:hypothetical protein FRB96_009642 [Tulasnella sp. 330]|nr:hypothetical protein FRB96_009642 [Tulasnella sp. 330]KAG8880609.1 hypothetical protein FRB97_000657 [Tulasnella sp. 331]
MTPSAIQLFATAKHVEIKVTPRTVNISPGYREDSLQLNALCHLSVSEEAPPVKVQYLEVDFQWVAKDVDHLIKMMLSPFAGLEELALKCVKDLDEDQLPQTLEGLVDATTAGVEASLARLHNFSIFQLTTFEIETGKI